MGHLMVYLKVSMMAKMMAEMMVYLMEISLVIQKELLLVQMMAHYLANCWALEMEILMD